MLGKRLQRLPTYAPGNRRQITRQRKAGDAAAHPSLSARGWRRRAGDVSGVPGGPTVTAQPASMRAPDDGGQHSTRLRSPAAAVAGLRAPAGPRLGRRSSRHGAEQRAPVLRLSRPSAVCCPTLRRAPWVIWTKSKWAQSSSSLTGPPRVPDLARGERY